MATTLLEKRLLDYKNKQTKNLSLDEIFVSYYLGTERGVEQKTKKLSELFIKEKKGDTFVIRPLRSYSELVKESAKGNVFVESSGIQPLPNDGKVVLAGRNYTNRTEPYYASFDVEESFETAKNVETTSTFDGKVSVTDSFVPHGLSRTMKVQEGEVTADNTYLMMILDGSSKQEFFKKSEIYYIDGASIVYLYENNHKIDFSKIKGKTLYVGNRIVDKIYTEKEYSFGEYQKFESVDADNLVKNSFELIKEPTQEDKDKVKTGEVVELNGLYYKKTSETKQDKYCSTATQISLTVDDPKKPGKTKTESYYAVKIYEVNKSGDYVSLRIKGGNKADMIEVSKLCDESGNPIDKNNILNYVGKSIKIKLDNQTTVETEQLTYEQAVYFYEKQYNYEPSVSADDVLEPNAYLQTAQGEFVKETYVAPISYKFTDKDTCDAYLIKIETEEGVKEKIVSKEDYKKVTKGLNLAGVYKLETTSFNDGKVIQTTNTGKGAEECRILGNYDAEHDVYKDLKAEDEELIRKETLEGFKEGYINGNYKVDYVYVDGKKVALDRRHKRFMYTDTHYMKDYAAETLAYSGLEKSSVVYKSKNGELGKFSGNSKLNFGKICKKAYGIWAKSLVYYIGISLTGAGMLAALIAPPLVVAAAGAIIAAPVLIPVIAGITCFFKNVLNRPFKDKTKFNRKKWSKNIEKELVAINDNMKETDFTKGLSKDALIARINKLKADVLASSKTTVGEGFQIVDGEIVVNGDNVNQVKAFKKEHKKELKDLKSRKNKVDKAKKIYEKLYKPFKDAEEKGLTINKDNAKYQEYIKAKATYQDLQELYDKEESRFNRTMSSHKGEALTYNADPNMESKLKRVDRLKNFWLVKKFTSKEDLLAQGFTEEEIKELDNVQYDPSKDMFITKNGEYVADTVKPKVWLSSEASIIIPEAKQETVDLLTKLKKSMSANNVTKPVEEEVVEKPKVDEEIIEETHEKPKGNEVVKKKRLNKQIITSENAVISELEDVESQTYEYIMKLLTKKSSKFAMTQKEAAAAIFDFTAKANQAHTDKMHAKDVLKASPLDYYILQKATTKMMNAATLNIK